MANTSNNTSNHKKHEQNCDCEHHHNHDCGCEHEHCHDDCCCGHEHETVANKSAKYGYLENVGTKDHPKYVRMCVLEEGELCSGCGACDICDLDPKKICDNCGKCIDTIATNDKGYVEIPAKLIMEEGDQSLGDLLAAYGLDGEDE